MARPSILSAIFVLSFVRRGLAHGDHSHVEEGQWISNDPMDAILWTHILMMGAAFGLIFPLGMVLGIVRSRWHVPVQVGGTVVAVVAYFLGHAHKGRQFGPNAHAKFANILMLILIAQISLGAYLKLHLERGFMAKIHKAISFAHGLLGKSMPVLAWTQIVFGVIASQGFCHEDHLGQCLAHFIMGSAFIAYGILLLILLLVGQHWLRRTGRSQEFFDSLVITLWGCFNTFTEHRWGGPWVRNDLQHTTMGIVWWCAGLLGMWLSRKRNGRPKRNLIPSLVIILTGYGMSAHPQHIPISEKIHTVFGYSLMGAGAVRIIEISFVLKDKSTLSPDGSNPSSWQFLPPFLLCASGFLFMSATEEQMMILHEGHITHVSYLLIIYSCVFILYLYVNVLIHVYAIHKFPESTQYAPVGARGRRHTDVSFSDVEPGRAHRPTPSQQIRDAQEFELEGLMHSRQKSAEVDADELDSPTEASGSRTGPLKEVDTGK